MVIKERVELQAADSLDAPEPLLSAEERARFFPGLFGNAKTAGLNNTITIPKDGTLRLAYGFAERLGAPYEAGDGLLMVMRNGQPAVKRMLATTSPTWTSATDTVFSPAWDGDPIFPVNCFGGSIDRYGYFTDELVDVLYTDMEDPITLNVEWGDEVEIVFVTTDFGGHTYGDDPDEGAILPDEDAPPGSPRWNGALGFYEPSCPYATDLLLFDVEYAVNLAFLRQDDSTIPTETEDAAEAVLMVSKFKTDDCLEEFVDPQNNNFFSPYTSVSEDGVDCSSTVGDKFTFRPQITGLEAGETVEFAVEVMRGDSAVYQETFQAVGDSLDAGTPEARYAYRGTQHLRLVSNARPPEIVAFDDQYGYLDHIKYDDEHLEKQTIRAELEDTVRVTLVVNGDTTDTVAELPVGRPPSEDGPYAIRTAYINVVMLPGLNPALPPQPATTTERMSEDWAQTAIRFDLADTTTITPVSNVLTVELQGTSTVAGTLSLEVEPQGETPTTVSIDIFAGDTEEQIAQRLANEISSQIPNVVAQHYRHFVENEDFWLVLADRGNEVGFRQIASTSNVLIKVPLLNLAGTGPIRLIEGNVLGLNFKDDDEETIDLFVVPLGTLPGVVGISGGDLRASNMPGWQNTIFVEETAVDGQDLLLPFDDTHRFALAFTVSHEAGHVLFDEEFPGNDSDPENYGHSLDDRNLLFRRTSTFETLDATKRLTMDQNTDARADSGPQTTPSLLHRERYADQ